MRNNLFLGAAAIALVAPMGAMAQETTSTIRGTVQSAGAPVAGAELVITHVPSGTRSTTTTDAAGGFNVTGLRTGGPFTVEVTSPQGSAQITDVYTLIGQPYDLPVELSPASSADIVVTASSIAGAGVTSSGPQTTLGQRDIQKVASVNRDIRDVERRDPFATLDLTNGRAVSFAGVNPRFNRFSVNGVLVGDNFGLNSDASPTGRGPIPFDAIAQVTVSIAPYDFRQGNFQGGAIDATLLSGTNTFHGTGFYSKNTDGLYGTRIGSFSRAPVSYNSQTYGATLSGPIIKDKLFFMVSGERNTEPRPFAITSVGQIQSGTSSTGLLTDAQVANVQSIAKSVYGYDTGGFQSLANNKDEKIVGKIDWNITDNQKFALTYINAFDQFEFQQNTSNTNPLQPSIGLASNGYRLTELLRSGIAQLNSDWSDNFSTEARVLYKSYTRTQDPLMGRGFAQFAVCLDPTSVGSTTQCTAGTTGGNVGSTTVYFGPDISRQSNAFNTDTYGGSLLANIKAGNHQIRLLTEVNRVSIYNLFLQYSSGAYYFDSLQDFQNRRASSLSYQNAVSLNTQDAAANFGYYQFTFGAQDSWRVNDSLNIVYGARYDLYAMNSTIPYNPNYQARQGEPNTSTYNGLGIFQPRVGFDYKPGFLNGLKLRGGAGIFGGGSPDVYLSNSFSNTGIITNRINLSRTATGFNTGTPTAVGNEALSNVTGTSFGTLTNGYLSTNTASLSTAPVAALARNFRLPSSMKATLSGDYTFKGIDFGADFIYSKVINQVVFTDARSRVIGRLPDGRNRYAAITNTGGTSVADTNTDILLTDTNKGRSYIFDVRAQKRFDFGLSFGGSYTYQDVKDASPATSSTPTSNYGNGAFLDPNYSAYGTSNDQTKWAFKYNLGFDHAFFRDYRTAIQLFGETRAGRPYSFTMFDSTGGTSTRSAVFGTLSNNNRYLLYVPTSTTDAIVSYDSTSTQQALDTLINNTELKNYRGKISGRNIARSRAFTRIDLHVEQEIPTFIGKSRFTLFGDIENLPNLLNHNWGGLRQLGFPYTASVIQVQCLTAPVATGATPTAAQVNTAANQACTQYRYSSYRDPASSAVNVANSLYLIRLGVRFTF